MSKPLPYLTIAQVADRLQVEHKTMRPATMAEAERTTG